MAKTFSVRLANEQVAELSALATFDGVAIAEEIREAISLLLKAKAQDPAFVQRVKHVYDNAGKMLAKLERGQELIKALGDPTRDLQPALERPIAASVPSEQAMAASADVQSSRDEAPAYSYSHG